MGRSSQFCRGSDSHFWSDGAHDHWATQTPFFLLIVLMGKSPIGNVFGILWNGGVVPLNVATLKGEAFGISRTITKRLDLTPGFSSSSAQPSCRRDLKEERSTCNRALCKVCQGTDNTAGVSSSNCTVTDKWRSCAHTCASSFVWTSPLPVTTVMEDLDLLRVCNSAELKSFSLNMCTDAPESITKCLPLGFCRRGVQAMPKLRCQHPLPVPRRLCGRTAPVPGFRLEILSSTLGAHGLRS